MPTERISAKDAAQAAVHYYQEVTSDYNQVSIAEVELSEDGTAWLITLMHKLPSNSPFATVEDRWGYKTFEIAATSGEVLSMKIKKI